MLVDVKYTRDRQLSLKKNLQDSVVKPVIFTAQKNEVFRLGTFLVNVSKSTVLCGYVQIYQINC